MSLVLRKPVFGVSDQVPDKLAAQPQKMVRDNLITAEVNSAEIKQNLTNRRINE